MAHTKAADVADHRRDSGSAHIALASTLAAYFRQLPFVENAKATDVADRT